MHKVNIAILALFLGNMPIAGMEKEADICALVSHNRQNIFKAVQESIEQGKFINIDAFVFTNREILESIRKAKENGAYIEVNVGSFSQNKGFIAQLREMGIQVTQVPHLHMKRILISEKDPRLGSPGKTTTFMGSSNLTYFAHQNFEAATTTQDATDYFMQQFENHQSLANMKTPEKKKEKLHVAETPCGLQLFTSRSYRLSESKALRIDKLARSKQQKRVLYISSMNWNTPAVTRALINAHEQRVEIKVIVNGSALRGGNEQLNELAAAGVPVFVFDPEGLKRAIQHSKLLLRFDGDDTLVINSTANLTSQGDQEFNVDEYSTNPQVAQHFKEAFDDYIEHHCVPYKHQQLSTKPYQPARKRLIFDTSDEQEQPTKKRRVQKK
ncbi:MAG TPA: phospholipase D-like domain-containing protein [Candidatus Dependentiae bacterium]|nr:phospholipase D-like domain-containing protein [Candidatus Dependentiae bacterium]HRQ63163.1 phospholipase D-like domain-containing protein [Candidatus Dependentiae bacterium]